MLSVTMLGLGKLFGAQKALPRTSAGLKAGNSASAVTAARPEPAAAAAPPTRRSLTASLGNVLPAGDLVAAAVQHRRPSAPAASPQPALQLLQAELQIKEGAALRDVFGAMVLSECIYKSVDVGQERAAQV